MPDSNPTPGLTWPTVEELRADNVRILEDRKNAVKFQRELMTTAWLTLAHEELLAVRAAGQIAVNVRVYSPNGAQQPEVARSILSDVVAALNILLPGAEIVGHEGDIVNEASVLIGWSSPS